MTTKERILNDEETRKMVLAEMTRIIPKLSENITLLENMFMQDEGFDPRKEKADIFGKPEMTMEEYFESEMKNLAFGVKFFEGDKLKDTINQRCAILNIQLDKIFRPESFIVHFLSSIDNLIFLTRQSLESRDIEDMIGFNLSSLKNEVLKLNKYLKRVKRVNLGQKTAQNISDLNEKLKKIPAPIIQL